MYKQRLYQILRAFIVICSGIGIYFLLKYTIGMFYPIILAVLFSMLLHPFVTFMETKLKFPRPLATITMMVMVFGLFIGATFLIVSELFQSTAYLAEQIPAHFQTLVHFGAELLNTKILPVYQKVISLFHTLDGSQQTTIHEHIKQFTNHIASTGAGLLQDGILKIPVLISKLPNSITVFLFTVLATFLITNDFVGLQQVSGKLFPVSTKRSVKNVIKQLKSAFTGYIKAQLILVFITACIIFFGLLLLGVEHTLTITLFAFVMDLLPYIGTGIIFIPWIIYLFITADFSLTIGITIIYMIIVVSRQVLEPKILSSSMGINPLAALISLFVGIQLWGVTGIIIAPILLIFINALYQAGIWKQIGLFIKG
ncbi:sporulation integral membrane protein YtvI [Virgibacillus halotolerans]|uniref:sporulation integral membrane protein YtvI n=1 Tax=Virgibacillus halotolerans TaxID=1071053 RepID=UPI001961F233|nr:sporulation integral membrane protein YtvI [Virgibacillus halotolerans]MBM7597724.1 sporulation integral membrane protein YtvI [Virgibacillus halotolerans]